MENSPLLLAIATFIAIILLYLVLSSFIASRRKEKNVLNRATKWSKNKNSSQRLDSGESDSKEKRFWSFLNFSRKKNQDLSAGIYADTPLFYQRAGIYNRNSIRYYQVLRFVLLLTPLVLLIAYHVLYYRPYNGVLVIGAMTFSYFGYILPLFWLRIVAHNRKKELNKTFPDAMDLLMVCVEAGMGIDSAIRRVSQEIHTTSPELGKEFKILSLELKTGRSRNSCLKNLALRADLPDVENLVSLLIQADRYGTGVTNALKVHSEEMRHKRFSRLEELAAKLPVKLTVPLILFIFPAFFVVIGGPAAIRVFRVIIQG